MNEKLLNTLVSEQKQTNFLLRELIYLSKKENKVSVLVSSDAGLIERGDRSPSPVERLEAPIGSAPKLSEVMTLVESWLSEARSSLSIGMPPPPVPGELILTLANLPNTLSQPVLTRGVDL